MQRFCPLERGEEVMALFGLQPDRYGYNFGLVLVLTVVVRFLAYACLRWSAWYHIKTTTGG
jgi:hypothetical protein